MNVNIEKKMSKLKYDELSLHMYNLGYNIKFINTNNIFNISELFYNAYTSISPINYIIYFDNIKKKIKKNNNLLITNVEEAINSIQKNNIKCDVLLFRNEEYCYNDREYDEEFKIVQNKYINNPIINKIDILDKNNFSKKNEKKYSNVIIKNNDFLKFNFSSFFNLTKLPNLMLTITNSLLRLEKNGNLFIFIGIPFLNNTLKKIIFLLENLFSKIEIISKIESSNNRQQILYCSGFLNNQEAINIYNKNIDRLINIVLKTQQYNYSSSHIMHFFYNYSKNNPDKLLMYHLDVSASTFNKKFQSTQKTMKIVDDIDIEVNENLNANYIIYQINDSYINFFNKMNYIISKNTKINKNTMYIDTNMLYQMQYQQLSVVIPILNENNIPYDKAYLSYIDKYNKNLVDRLHSLDNNIKSLLTKTARFLESTQWKKLQTKTTKTYYYDELNNLQEMYKLAIKTNDLSINRSGFSNRIPPVIKTITDNYSRGVAKYINKTKKYKVAFPVSNGFTKIWEMLTSVILLPNQKDRDINVFFIAEAPGQWIYSIDYFIKKKLDNVKKWDWRATSLNPNHPVNIETFGKGILDDAYGFIKHYPDKWLWGVDQTGDITKSANIKWYHQYVKEWAKPNLVTGDAGIQSDNPIIYQKLELAQVLMVAAVSAKGGNCIIKHFLPYIPNIEETYQANGFFINYIYLYYLMFEDVYLMKPLSSNPVSGEFYLVGKNFIGIDEMMLDKMLGLLDNFEVNMCFFKKEDIPEHFRKQVFSFIGQLTKMNVDFIDIQNTLLTCLYKRDNVIEKVTECRKYLNPAYMEEIQEAKFKKWVDIYNFE